MEPLRTLAAAWLGRVDYGDAWRTQQDLFAARLRGAVPDSVMLLEHPPTYTLGRRTEAADMVLSREECAARGIAVHDVDRGGRATFHGPGQLVGYPIVALGERYDVVRYLRDLEEAVIRTLSDLGVVAGRDPDHTGVWVGTNKIGAIGVKITRGITMHGFALNLATDLSMFSGIVPCGIADRGVTSALVETGTEHHLDAVARLAAGHLAEVLGRELGWVGPDQLLHPRDLEEESA